MTVDVGGVHAVVMTRVPVEDVRHGAEVVRGLYGAAVGFKGVCGA